jgi:hypothetical protein
MAERRIDRAEVRASLPALRELSAEVAERRLQELLDARLLIVTAEERWRQVADRVTALVLNPGCRKITGRPRFGQRIGRVTYKDGTFRCYLEEDAGEGVWVDEDPPRPIRVPVRWFGLEPEQIREELSAAHKREAERRLERSKP